jgi:hypothetical protein
MRAQLAVGIDDATHSRFGAARGSAAQQLRQDFHPDVGDGTH